jgi:thioredoxin reductase
MRDLVIVGGGPAGLSAAVAAQRLGLTVTVLEREAEAGGAPRHCGHLGFGMLDMARLWTGPRYAAALRGRAGGLDLRCGHAVTALQHDGVVAVSGPEGPYMTQGRRVLLAMGIREQPRSAQLVSGNRPFGILTTGALQRFVYLHNRLPCRNPVIIGTEIVAYSTILTLRHLGAKPVALLDERPNVQASSVISVGARIVFGVPSFADVTLDAIHGEQAVEAVSYTRNGVQTTLACDGVVFSGRWVPEAFLARAHPMGVDAQTQGPAIDAQFRTPDPQIYAAGNVLRSVRNSGQCALEGRRVAGLIARDLGRPA